MIIIKLFSIVIIFIEQMQNWAVSKQQPGTFTGSTGAQILSQAELSSGYQAWARKVLFTNNNLLFQVMYTLNQMVLLKAENDI